MNSLNTDIGAESYPVGNGAHGRCRQIQGEDAKRWLLNKKGKGTSQHFTIVTGVGGLSLCQLYVWRGMQAEQPG